MKSALTISKPGQNASEQEESGPKEPERTRPVGRPKDLQKRQNILEAAAHLFMKNGYKRTSVAAIAEAAQISKATVYSHFKDKKNLFREIILQKVQHYEVPGDDSLGKVSFRQKIYAIANGFMELMCDPDVNAMHRVISSEAQTAPEITEMFFEAGPQEVITHVAKVIEAATKSGEISVAEPHYNAIILLSMLKGTWVQEREYGLRDAPTEPERQKWTAYVVEMFLRGCGYQDE